MLLLFFTRFVKNLFRIIFIPRKKREKKILTETPILTKRLHAFSHLFYSEAYAYSSIH